MGGLSFDTIEKNRGPKKWATRFFLASLRVAVCGKWTSTPDHSIDSPEHYNALSWIVCVSPDLESIHFKRFVIPRPPCGYDSNNELFIPEGGSKPGWITFYVKCSLYLTYFFVSEIT